MTAGHAEWGIVRILASRPGKPVPVGAGFLVSDRYALTCAHVVNESLRLDAYTADWPAALVFFDLPGGAEDPSAATQAPLTACVIAWHPAREPPQQGQPEDIAVLELAHPCAAERALALLRPASATVPPGYQGYAYGFPERGDTGIWAKGELSGHQHYGWRQVDDLAGPAIAAGFSGCPFLDAAQERALGMVVARHGQFPVSYLIPVAVLHQAWPELARIARQVDLPELAEQRQNLSTPMRKVETGGSDSVGRDQAKVVINNFISVPGAPPQPEQTVPPHTASWTARSTKSRI